MIRFLDIVVVVVAKVLVRISRATGHGGSALPGLLAQRIRPGLLGRLASSLPGGVILVTGTNGKTTTSKMLTSALEQDGRIVFANRSGSNMVRGLLSAAIDQCDLLGRLDATVAVLEVDEPNMEAIASVIAPDIVLVLNLHRDQLDRYGELEHTANLIGRALPLSRTVVLNSDDPLVAALAERSGSATVRWFGLAESLRDAVPHDANLLTDHHRTDVPRTTVDARLLEAEESNGKQQLVIDVGDTTIDVDLPLTGVYNAVNATAAALVLNLAGVDSQTTADALGNLVPAFGRGETVTLGDTCVRLQLVKNPSSFSHLIWTQLGSGPNRDLLFALNDNEADGRDVSWIWDVDFEALAGRGDRIVVTGTRATDLAVRLKYAGLAPTVVEEALEPALDRFLASHKAAASGSGTAEDNEVAIIVPTYTALLRLREIIGHRTPLAGIWT